MANVSVGPDCSSDAASILIHGAFRGFAGAAERLEQAYASLRDQVTALDCELHDTNRRLTQSLQENTRIRQYLSNLLKSIEKGIVVVDPAGRITLWSGGAERLTGFAATEALGQPAHRLLGGDIATFLRGLPGDAREGAREGRIMRKD